MEHLLGSTARPQDDSSLRPRPSGRQPTQRWLTGAQEIGRVSCSYAPMSARSQMAEGLLRGMAEDRFEVFSAGTGATRVRPEAISVMAEIGVDICPGVGVVGPLPRRNPGSRRHRLRRRERGLPGLPGARERCTGPSPTLRKPPVARETPAGVSDVRDEIRARIRRTG